MKKERKEKELKHLAAGEARKAIFWPTTGFRDGIFVALIFSRRDLNFLVHGSPPRGKGGTGVSVRLSQNSIQTEHPLLKVHPLLRPCPPFRLPSGLHPFPHASLYFWHSQLSNPTHQALSCWLSRSFRPWHFYLEQSLIFYFFIFLRNTHIRPFCKGSLKTYLLFQQP